MIAGFETVRVDNGVFACIVRCCYRFMCLEFSRVSIEPLQKAYDWYSFNVIPTLGEVMDTSTTNQFYPHLRTGRWRWDIPRMHAAVAGISYNFALDDNLVLHALRK